MGNRKVFTPMARVHFEPKLLTFMGNIAAIVIEINHEDSEQWTMAAMYPVSESTAFPYAGKTFISLNVLESISDLVGRGYRIVIE